VEGVDLQDADIEDLLDRDLDLGLVGVRVNQERVPVPVQFAVALLRYDRRDDDVPRISDRGHLASSLPAAAVAATGVPRNSFSASVVKTTASLTSTSYVLSWPATIRWTLGSLRSESQLSSSFWPSTTRTRRASVTLRRVASAAL